MTTWCLSLTAAWLLSLPPGSYAPPVWTNGWLGPSLLRESLALDVVDDGWDADHKFRPVADDANDLNLIRGRLALYRNYPHSWEAQAWAQADCQVPVPGYEESDSQPFANAALDLGERYRQHLSDLQQCYGADPPEARWLYLEELKKESQHLSDCWVAAERVGQEAKDAPGHRCRTCCRQRLKELRDLLGPEAYYQHRLPPPVPVWRFRDGDL